MIPQIFYFASAPMGGGAISQLIIDFVKFLNARTWSATFAYRIEATIEGNTLNFSFFGQEDAQGIILFFKSHFFDESILDEPINTEINKDLAKGGFITYCFDCTEIHKFFAFLYIMGEQ